MRGLAFDDRSRRTKDADAAAGQLLRRVLRGHHVEPLEVARQAEIAVVEPELAR